MTDITVIFKLQQGDKIIERQTTIKQEDIDKSEWKPRYAIREIVDELTDDAVHDWVHGDFDKS